MLLANRAWFDWKRLGGFEWIDVDPREPHAGNALQIGIERVFPTSFPHTARKMEEKGLQLELLEIGELQKAESGLTCSSLLFEA